MPPAMTSPLPRVVNKRHKAALQSLYGISRQVATDTRMTTFGSSSSTSKAPHLPTGIDSPRGMGVDRCSAWRACLSYLRRLESRIAASCTALLRAGFDGLEQTSQHKVRKQGFDRHSVDHATRLLTVSYLIRRPFARTSIEPRIWSMDGSQSSRERGIKGEREVHSGHMA